jgi:hypothetical protein
MTTMRQFHFVRRIASAVVLGLVVVALSASAVLAAVTWHSGPTVTFNGATSATASGDGSGFGNQPASATLTVNATVTYTCVNKGGNASPGQNPVPETSSGSADLGNADHNGRGTFNFTVSFTPQAVVDGKTAGCPNGNWQGVNPVSSGITGATLTITQGNKTIYSQFFDNPNN